MRQVFMGRGFRQGGLAFAVLLVVAGASVAPAGEDEFLGDWSMTTRLEGGEMTATMTLFLAADGSIGGRWVSGGREMDLVEIEIEGHRIRFDREIPGGTLI